METSAKNNLSRRRFIRGAGCASAALLLPSIFLERRASATLSRHTALAATTTPNITGFSGTLQHGALATIAGTGFGTKQPVAPLIWDTMEAGAFSSSWSSTGDLRINSTNNRHSRSRYNGYVNFRPGAGKSGAFTGGSDSRTWFAQYWFMLGSNFDWGSGTYGQTAANLANIKFFRMWSTGTTQENVLLEFYGPAHSAVRFVEYIETSNSYFWSTYATDITRSVWHCLQFEYRDSDLNVANGVIRMWFDGRLKLNVTNRVTRKASSAYKRPKVLGFWDSWDDSGTDNDDFYIDDAYVDKTWARVELGNATTYSACTQREIQLPTAWSDQSVSVKLNQGCFSSLQNTYVYLVNASGLVNTQGYHLQ